MDLAICWDYHPKNPKDEPKRPKHIDGSNGSAAPAVFTLIKTPRTPDKIETSGRTGGIFTNTFGEPGFFDKDILRKQAAFTQKSKSDLKCSCGTSPINFNNDNPKTNNVVRENSGSIKNEERYKSSPNLSQLAVTDHVLSSREMKNSYHLNNEKWCKQNRVHTCSKYNNKSKHVVNNSHVKVVNTNLNRHKSNHQSQIYPQKITKSNDKINHKRNTSKNNLQGSDSGCSTMSSSISCPTKVLHVPKPRHPYSKKNYNIDTLVPPFTCYKGGAGQGGYPEHWRLATIYQHSYKPIEQRKASLMETVFK